ncbi:MAG: glycosyltransferase family 4 protein [Anaerolineae bacterium]
MRVALISRAVFGLHGYGGMERHVLELARFLHRAGAEVTLVTMPPHRQAEWTEPGIDLQVVTASRLPLRGIADRVTNYPYWSRAAGELVASRPFDVVHAQGLSGWGYARLLAQGRAHAPLIIAPQGMEEFKTSLAKRIAYIPFHLMAQQAAESASALIAADSAAVADIPRFLHASPDRVVLIPNGIDVDAALQWVDLALQRDLALRFQLQNRTPLLLSVGRLESNKGFDVLLEALGRIRPSLPSRWLWLLVGAGSQRARLEKRARVLKLGDHVRFLGALDDLTLHNLYEMATLFVHPTLFEGSVLVTLEAMAHRRPVVATAVGGNPDKVLRGRNGYLVAPGNPVELGDKILLALRDAVHLREMGQASYEIVRQAFDWPQTISQTLALYAQVIGKPALAMPQTPLSANLPLNT